jgi:ParB family chromosome partitioning protein
MKKIDKMAALGASLGGLSRLQTLASEPELATPSTAWSTIPGPAVRIPTIPSPSGAPPGYLEFQEGVAYPPGSRIWLPLTKTKEHPRNPRYFYFDEDSDWKSLLRSLATHGQLEPAQAYEIDELGAFPLKSGHRRRRMLSSLGKTHIAVEIVAPSKSALDDYVQARALNVEHKVQSHFDDAIRFKELLDEGVAPDAQSLALALGIPKSEMSKSLSIAELPHAVIEQLAKNLRNFGLSAAYLIFSYWKKVERDEELTMALVNRAILHEWSVRTLEGMVKEHSSTTNISRKKRESALSRVELSGTGTGELKAFDGRISLEIGTLTDEKRNQIFSKIVEVFKNVGIIVDEGVPRMSE